MLKWLENAVVNHIEGLRKKQREVEPESIPPQLLPFNRNFVKDVKIKKVVRSSINGNIVFYVGDNNRTYVDDSTLPTVDEINALMYPRPG